MAQAVENEFNWRTDRGLSIVKTAVIAIEYDEESKKLVNAAQADDVELRKAARMGQVYSNNMTGMMAAASGEAMKTAAGNENGSMMGFMGMNMAAGAAGSMMQAANQGSDVEGYKPSNEQPEMGTLFGKKEEKIETSKEESSKSTEEPIEKSNEEATGRFCPNCGKEATGNFCSYCGTKIE